jgi:hypothetical protein
MKQFLNVRRSSTLYVHGYADLDEDVARSKIIEEISKKSPPPEFIHWDTAEFRGLMQDEIIKGIYATLYWGKWSDKLDPRTYDTHPTL